MNILPVGIGGAGNRLVEKFLEHSESSGYQIPDGILIDVEKSKFYSVDQVSESNCVILDNGDAKFNDMSQRPLLSIKHNSKLLQNALYQADIEDADCFFVIGGLGGQLGSHSGIVANWLQEQYNLPVYGLGILPTEQEGNLAAAFAAEGLNSLRESSDGVVIFDNDGWDLDDESKIKRANEEIINRVGMIFWAAASKQNSAPSSLTVEQLDKALSVGDYVTCGYSAVEVNPPDRHSYFNTQLAASKEEREKNKQEAHKRWSNKDRREMFSSLSKRSTHSQLTLSLKPSEIGNSERVLIIAVGYSDIMSDSHMSAARIGFEEAATSSLGNISVENIDTACFGLDTSQLVIITLFSVSERVSRLDQLFSMAQQGPNITNNRSERQNQEAEKSLTDRLHSMADITWRRENLCSSSSQKFEYLIAEIYKSLGDTSKLTQANHDGGVDVIVDQQDGTRLVVQVKQYSSENTVGRPTVQQTVGVREEHNASVAVVISSSSFTDPAIELANRTDDTVRLISGQELVAALNESSLRPSDFLK